MPQPDRSPSAGAASRDDSDLGWWRRRRAAKKSRLAAMTPRRRIARRLGVAATWLLGLVAVMMVAAVVLFYTLSDVPRPETLPLPRVATILYSDGKVMARIGSVDRLPVPLSKVPTQVRWDVIAAEDRGFYSEPGISIRGTLRAAFADLTGGDTQGGSGITQQYVKNAYLSDARTLTRKLKELAIAVKLSREYSKNQILEFYLNTVYFGRGAYGIQAAAHAFFNKDVSTLNTAQGAVLAALLRAPSYYDPAVNPGPAKDRWRYVLDGMVSTGHLTQAQENAMRYPHVIAPRNSNGLTVSGPKAIIAQRVIDELGRHGISEEEVYARGMTIRTSIDEHAQAAAESAIRQTFAHLSRPQRHMKNALVAVDPRTGGVLAYYGGPDGLNYAHQHDYYDYAGLGSAAPGSSFKPYTLATALTQTLHHKSHGTPVTVDAVVDGSYCVTIQATRICNDPSDRPYSSAHVTVANAMKYSLNTTFDQMAAQVGPSNVAATAHAAGVSATINGKPSLVGPSGQTTFGIGIGDYPVHPIDQAVGFATFANHGTANPPWFVEQATDGNGDVVYTHKADPHRAVGPKVANDVTLALEPIAAWSGDALAGGRESAAKTGTEGIQTGKYTGQNSDAWMVGYTPQVSAAVWVGSGNSTTPIYDAYGGQEYGRDLPGRTWKLFMDTYLAHRPMLPMASHQEVFAEGQPAPVTTTSAAPVTSAPPTHSATPSPTFSTTSGFATPTPTPTHAKPTPTSSTPPPPPSTTPGCSQGLLGPNCTSPPASSPTSASSSASSASSSPSG